MTSKANDIIAAIATPPGYGGVGIVRLSGPGCYELALKMLALSALRPRYAHHTNFLGENGAVLDDGLVLFFPNPHSYTGEDVVELQGHGGPVVLAMILKRCLALGARQAEPGEFSLRAYLNQKIDLNQAEAISDLIHAQTEQAVHVARRSLSGAFSQHVDALAQAILKLRIYVEAAIDFPEEEVDFLQEGEVATHLASLCAKTAAMLASARQGALMQQGAVLCLAGLPNAGKSSLMNRLSGQETAIVTEIPGTTRDLVRETLVLEGMLLHVVDTAGLRVTQDRVEQEGILRAKKAIQQATHLVWLIDAKTCVPTQAWDDLQQLCRDLELRADAQTVVLNKVDTVSEDARQALVDFFVARGCCVQTLSCHTGEGISAFIQHLVQTFAHDKGAQETAFSARERHIIALEATHKALLQAQSWMLAGRTGELVAEDLVRAHQALVPVCGRVSSDDLLGHIFSSFCIGK